MDLLQAIIIAIIEGITEYLPVSSTGHMIFASSYFGIEKEEFVKLFQVSIQFGAILAVVVLYWKKFFDFSKLQFFIKLACAVVPALILGKLFDDKMNLELQDILVYFNYFITTAYGIGKFDDKDHLGNRRVRLVGELVEQEISRGSGPV